MLADVLTEFAPNLLVIISENLYCVLDICYISTSIPGSHGSVKKAKCSGNKFCYMLLYQKTLKNTGFIFTF